MLTELGKLNRDTVKGSIYINITNLGQGGVVIPEKGFIKDTSLLMEVMGLVNKGLLCYKPYKL